MNCRSGCAACCIAPSISSPIPGMPYGKPAGVRCVQLTDDLRCALFGKPERPAVCASLRPSEEMCGETGEEAAAYLARLERLTAPVGSGEESRQEGPAPLVEGPEPALPCRAGQSLRLLGTLIASLLAAPPVVAQALPGWASHFSVHGYVSQAYAKSEDHQIFGIPTGGTADYRDLALQLRYDPNERNEFLVQLRHQRFGESSRDDKGVDLDWAFYGHRFSDRFAVKAGRIPLPLGIFNEADGAAATSPFFRPPYEFYDRQYTSKTLDGALATMTVGRAAGWSFDVDAYGGRWALEQWGYEDKADANDAWGAQVWANSPIPGVRVGAGAYRCRVEPAAGTDADYLMLHASIDADLDRWRFATEYMSGNLDLYGRYRAAYAQAGYQFTRRLSLHGRASVARMTIPINGHSIEPTLSEDFGLSLNFAPHPALLLKLEGHTNEGYLREDVPRDLYGDPSETRYFIASVVATF